MYRMPTCQVSDFALHIKPEQTSYSISSSQRMVFDITMTYQGSVECNGYTGANAAAIYISNSQGQLVFSDQCDDACGSYPPKDPLTPGEPVVNTTAWWDYKQCNSRQCWDCRVNCSPEPPVPPGAYTVYAASPPYKQSNTASFQLTP
jgi:hypothetical protein